MMMELPSSSSTTNNADVTKATKKASSSSAAVAASAAAAAAAATTTTSSSSPPSRSSTPQRSSRSSSSTTKKCSQQEKRTFFLRVLFVSTMIVTGVVFAILTYTILSNSEENAALQTYESIAQQALDQAQKITLNKQRGADSLATALSFGFPNAAQWPFVGLRAYSLLATKVALLSASAGHGFMTIVKPNQVIEFENHAKELYKKFDYPDGSGYSEFGFGIYGIDNSPQPNYTDKRFHDNTGETKWNSKYKIMVPFLQHKNTFSNPGLLQRNLYQFPLRGKLMESQIDCSIKAKQEAEAAKAKAAAIAAGNGTAASLGNNSTTANITTTYPAEEPDYPKCGAVTDFTEIFVRPGPSAVFFDPIYPADDPHTIVGFIGTSINWAEVLTNVVPDFVNGLHCVISNNKGTSHTYVIEHGVPILLDDDDSGAEDRDDIHARSILLNDLETGALATTSYTLTLYPSQELFEDFASNSPKWAAIGFAGVIFICILLFLCYDYFMKYEAHQRKLILDVKRRFVRFVSHEVRTPLNVVVMGLDLMLDELRVQKQIEKVKAGTSRSTSSSSFNKLLKNNEDMDITDISSRTAATATSCSAPSSVGAGAGGDNTEVEETVTDRLMQLAVDIQENSNNAVTVLSDLLNYDKVESGTFELEYGTVEIFKSVEKTVSEFAIQARNRNITIHYRTTTSSIEQTQHSSKDVEASSSSSPLQTAPNSNNLIVLADERRLNLVIRNLISNALKFCENKDIVVTLTHHPDDTSLPHATDEDAGHLDLKGLEEEETDVHQFLSSSEAAGSVSITVQDRGVGLSQEQLALLFDEGIQFNPEVLQHGGGSGLGLFITREIVKQHNGTIDAHSDGMGSGTAFTVHLPLYKKHQLDTALTEANSSTRSGGSTAEQDYSHSVLVVDDVLSNRKMLVRLLERAGHTCVMASDGLEAVDAYLENKRLYEEGETTTPFDTILMDYEMPNMNGPDATKRLRDLGCTADIFGVTGNVLAEDVANFRSKGADRVLYKPIRLPNLDTAWEKMGERRKAKSNSDLNLR